MATKAIERKVRRQGGVARHRTIIRGGEPFTCAVTRKEGPRRGRTVCWPRESMSSLANRLVDQLLEVKSPHGYATCPVCGHPNVHVSEDGKLLQHGDWRTGSQRMCAGGGQQAQSVRLEPVEGQHPGRFSR